MTALLSVGEAERLTARIKLTAATVRDGLERLRSLVDEAQNSNAWQILGFQSWTAYLVDTLASEPMRLPREQRLEVVEWLAGEGLSTRAIAPIVGAGLGTVARDMQAIPSVPNGTVDTPIQVDTATGEIVDAPRVEETTVTEKHKVTIGLNGKHYQKPQPKPKPEPLTGDALEDESARRNAEEITNSLAALDSMRTPAHRVRVIETWWPRATRNGTVPPWGRELFRPEPIRNIAQALMELAEEIEIQS